MFQCSVIIAFYNNIRFLELVLAGFVRQSEKDFEIIIADDGSQGENKQKAEEIIKAFGFNFQYLWHADDGFRKNIILNRAVVAARSEKIIFIDQDCIPHRHFIRQHIRRLRIGIALTGRRVNLSLGISNSLDKKLIEKGYLENINLKLLWQSARKEMNHGGNGIYLPYFAWVLTRRNRGVLGCNFSVMKEDLLRINGFDERYLHPTIGEDSDIDLRLRNAGVKILYVGHLAIQYHLFHALLSRENENYKILEANRILKMARTPYGIIKEE